MRHYQIPAGYPVPAEHIPDMPIDVYHLHAFGWLTPVLMRAMGVKEMSCGYCGEACEMRLLREPLGPDGVNGDAVLGPLNHGEDVALICPCCSAPGCTHRARATRRAAAP